MNDQERLVALLEAEHASVYAYGVVGARLDERTRELALQAFDAHRTRRSALTARLQALGVVPPSSLPAYDVVADTAPAALRLAVQVEVGNGVLWRDLVTTTEDPALRSLGVQSLTDTAVRAARWRRLAGIRPATEAFPGKP